MGENSGSRYGIVERLTNAKLEILEEKHQLEDTIGGYKNTLINEEKDYVAWEKQFALQKEKERSDREAGIDKIKNKIKYLTESMNNKKQMMDVKIEEINKALDQIREISKESSGSKE